MADYLEWNTRIIEYFISSVQEGQGLYLTINEDVLAAIDARTGGSRLNETIVENFQQAVRDKVITGDGSVNLAPLNCFTSEGEPMGVAFLAAQVLTAFRMADDSGIDEMNYFSRLRDFLGIQAKANELGRPSSMNPGFSNEKPLWDMWGRWLQWQGYVDTAESGEGSRVYVSLPISQLQPCYFVLGARGAHKGGRRLH